MEKLPTYELTIDENNPESGVFKVSLVDNPAIEVNWFAFKKHMKQRFNGEFSVYGYTTKNFDLSPEAVAVFAHLIGMNVGIDEQGMIRSAAQIADSIFGIIKEAMEEKEEAAEKGKEVLILVDDFKDLMSEIDKLVGMKHDTSFMDKYLIGINGFKKQSFETYADYPKAASENAARAIELRDKYDLNCGTLVGWQRASSLSKGENISRDTIARMAAFERHRQNSSGDPKEDCGALMWLAWGGDEGIEWAQRKLAQIDRGNMVVEPKEGETKEEFVSRCIGEEINSGKEQEQAAAICYAKWDDKYKASKKEFNSSWSFANKEKQMLAGAFMIPDLPIYRRDDELGEYNVVFTKETIEKLALKFNEQARSREINEMHGDKMSPAFIAENWIIEDSEQDKSNKYGFALPVGTWFGIVKITDKDYWDSYIKTGELRGFSIEGMLELNKKNINNKHKQMQKFSDATLADGTKITTPSEEWVVGAEVYVLDAEGNQSPAPDGVHTLDNGMIITTKDGKIVEVSTPETSDEEMNAETTAFQITPEIEAAINAAIDAKFAPFQSEVVASLAEMRSALDAITAKTAGSEEKMSEVIANMAKLSTIPHIKSAFSKDDKGNTVIEKKGGLYDTLKTIKNNIKH